MEIKNEYVICSSVNPKRRRASHNACSHRIATAHRRPRARPAIVLSALADLNVTYGRGGTASNYVTPSIALRVVDTCRFE